MKFHHSLHTRIIFAFCLFGVVLGTAYATAVYISLDLIDDHLIDNRLREEIEYFTNYYKYHHLLPRSTSPYITAHLGRESMPLYLIELVKGLDEGLHEAYSGPDEYHIAVQKLLDGKKHLYLLYEVSALEFTEKRKLNIGFVLFGGVILITLLGWWIGRLTSRKVIAPVIHLSDQVNRSGPENLPTNLSKDFIADEVGTLAAVLEQSMQRIEAFVEREHQFTRDASHELRTPVTVIKGAVEILRKQLNPIEEPVLRPLDRIQRQVTNMENIIEALLWLSREEISAENTKTFPVLPLVRSTIEESRQLIVKKTIDISLAAEGNPVLGVPAPLFQIALSNLIQNAVRYTSNGHVSVHVRDDRLVVSDTGSGIKESDLDNITQPHIRGTDSNGFGLGLSIVKRLCDRFGWQFEIKSEVDRGTTAQLIFGSSGE
ncbi:MAG: HAMP domain-containing sensor histidine kinase [Desulfobacterales bacterium]|jgi:signal transduction histidine kinase